MTITSKECVVYLRWKSYCCSRKIGNDNGLIQTKWNNREKHYKMVPTHGVEYDVGTDGYNIGMMLDNRVENWRRMTTDRRKWRALKSRSLCWCVIESKDTYVKLLVRNKAIVCERVAKMTKPSSVADYISIVLVTSQFNPGLDIRCKIIKK